MALHVRRALGLLLAISGLFSIAGPISSVLGAEFEIAPNGFSVEMLDAEGHPENRAGSHPDLFKINFALNLEGTTARDLEFELPPGLGGNPAAVPQCPRVVFESSEECPPETQVGFVEIALSGLKFKLPLFEVEPLPGQVIAFGSKPNVDLPFTSELRPGDLGSTLKANDLPQEPITEGHFVLWGVPADHQEGTSIPRRPFLTAPPTCEPVSVTFRTRSWQDGAPWLSATSDTGVPLTGCTDLNFDPQFSFQLSDPVADSPTGLRIDLSMPEEAEGSELADAPIKNATVELPAGIGVSPGGAGGLAACTDAQLGLGGSAAAQCPQSSKIGAAEFSALGLGSLTGAIYLGEEHPGQRFRVYVVAPGPGVALKFVSTLRVDPATGRLSTVMQGLPQVPIQRISLIFDGGPHALLASPLTCGPSTAIARLDPHGDGPPVESTASVQIEPRTPGSPCTGAAPFSPQLQAGTSTLQAGHKTTFSSTLRRQAGEQLPRRFSISLPEGLGTALGTVQICPTDATVGGCPPASKVGSVLAEVGSGPSSAALRGNVYLTGPYRRAPFSLLMEFRGAIGPFDLGSFAFRATANLDGSSGRFTVSSDPLPNQVEGVQIRFQTIRLDMDRPGLIRNPTSCSPRSTDAAFEAQGGDLAAATSPLTPRGCNRLGFKPNVQMAFVGPEELHKSGTPTLRVKVRLRTRDTNLRGMKLSLPPVLRFGSAGLGEICSRWDAMAGLCPSGSRVGTARALTPLLNNPLNGSIYMVQPNGDGLPDMWVSIAAMGVHMDLRGRTFAAADGHLVTKLAGLPDMPLSALTMRLGGRETGIFSLSVSPCTAGRPRRFQSHVATRGQSGARHAFRAPIRMNARCAVSSEPGAHAAGRPAHTPAGAE